MANSVYEILEMRIVIRSKSEPAMDAMNEAIRSQAYLSWDKGLPDPK